jgi:hypothetical protein
MNGLSDPNLGDAPASAAWQTHQLLHEFPRSELSVATIVQVAGTARNSFYAAIGGFYTAVDERFVALLGRGRAEAAALG